ncbi:hypothetical protein CRV24_001703 [Beauveria bassiana]|nr:hypothetical protein CRV24_001703 [Beauveria bassiana]
MQAMAGVPFDCDSPWGFWFFILHRQGSVQSTFNDERRLKWFNSVRISTRAFIVFADTAVSFDEKEDAQNGALYILELDFLKPRPRESIKLFWKPARPPIYRSVRLWLETKDEPPLAQSATYPFEFR